MISLWTNSIFLVPPSGRRLVVAVPVCDNLLGREKKRIAEDGNQDSKRDNIKQGRRSRLLVKTQENPTARPTPSVPPSHRSSGAADVDSASWTRLQGYYIGPGIIQEAGWTVFSTNIDP
ncbi:hypothetical protein FOZG_18547 [Fusarium oxysporum Fo47]|uniref:Uncharacterized protein n=1 Tax=Fusarium oxysporum Fo47 TaxID=660027 RepID=W9JDL1_FUSOX|nr:hypothetical protein FOZG_18547 [Fusarium oxysporum Fo47]